MLELIPAHTIVDGHSEFEIVCIETDGDVPAFVASIRGHFRNRPTAYIERLFVREGHRRSRAGSALVAAFEVEAKSQGCTKVTGTLHPETTAADFWKFLNYEPVLKHDCGATRVGKVLAW